MHGYHNSFRHVGKTHDQIIGVSGRMKGPLTLLVFALHGFSLMEQSGALHAVANTRNNRRNAHGAPCRARSSLVDRNLQGIISPNGRSVYRIRGGSLEDATISTTPSSTSLSGVARTVGIVDGILPLGILGSINSFFKYHPYLASFLICK